jgi:hypothetical protein
MIRGKLYQSIKWLKWLKYNIHSPCSYVINRNVNGYSIDTGVLIFILFVESGIKHHLITLTLTIYSVCKYMANFWVAKEVHYTLSTVIDLNNLLKLLHLGVKWIKPTWKVCGFLKYDHHNTMYN